MCFDEAAKESLFEHLEAMAKREKLRMLTKPELQESWGRLNTHLVGNRMKTGPKTLPTLTVKWFENDLRKLGRRRAPRFARDGPREPKAFAGLREDLERLEEKDGHLEGDD